MPRSGRIIAPGLPHHVTARGNRREPIFFESGDPERYKRMLAEEASRRGVEVWAYCLMPNHVHLIMTPPDHRALGLVIGEAHRRWSGFINARANWTGRLFEGRFSSLPMDETHLAAAFRYVAQNPVRAGLVARVQDWAWASTRAHIRGSDDELVRVRPLLDRVDDVLEYLQTIDEPGFVRIRNAERSGRPLGPADFVADLERRLGRPIARRSAGRPPTGDRMQFPKTEIASSPQ